MTRRGRNDSKRRITNSESRIMKYVFFGTPAFAVIILRKLVEAGVPPKLVVANPDRPVGRERTLTSPPTVIFARQHSIPVWQPVQLTLEELKNKIQDAEFALVVTYSHIIKKSVIDFFPLGIIGIHYSLLPKYRGPSPVQSAILSGETEIGISFSLMN